MKVDPTSGGEWAKPTNARRRLPFVSALLVAIATLPLLFLGGVVTSEGAGMSVPDWPRSFGYFMFTLPMEYMRGPVALEHSHRLLGSLVGILAIYALITSFVFQARKSVRWMALAVLLLVSAQGVIGGLRVVDHNPGLAPVHGCFAQLVFAVMAAFVTVSSPLWVESVALPVDGGALSKARWKAWLLVALCYLQVILGAWYRHSAGARIEPHATNAIVILGLAGMTTAAVRRLAPGRAWLRSTGKLLNALLGVQLLLGIVAFFAKRSATDEDVKVFLVSAHIVLGALVLGFAVSLALKLHRDLVAGDAAAPSAAAAPTTGDKLAGAGS